MGVFKKMGFITLSFIISSMISSCMMYNTIDIKFNENNHGWVFLLATKDSVKLKKYSKDGYSILDSNNVSYIDLDKIRESHKIKFFDNEGMELNNQIKLMFLGDLGTSTAYFVYYPSKKELLMPSSTWLPPSGYLDSLSIIERKKETVLLKMGY